VPLLVQHVDWSATEATGRTAVHRGKSGRAWDIATREASQYFPKLAPSEYSIADTALVHHAFR